LRLCVYHYKLSTNQTLALHIHATYTTHAAWGVVFRCFCNHALGRQHQADN
jgi:hypothetical protein